MDCLTVAYHGVKPLTQFKASRQIGWRRPALSPLTGTDPFASFDALQNIGQMDVHYVIVQPKRQLLVGNPNNPVMINSRKLRTPTCAPVPVSSFLVRAYQLAVYDVPCACCGQTTSRRSGAPCVARPEASVGVIAHNPERFIGSATGPNSYDNLPIRLIFLALPVAWRTCHKNKSRQQTQQTKWQLQN